MSQNPVQTQAHGQSRMRLPPSLDGAYRIVRDIGQGAYGLVWYVYLNAQQTVEMNAR
ncbi:hypothetical protein LPJ57_009941, partial [Coemansia sp. RSA 486]